MIIYYPSPHSPVDKANLVVILTLLLITQFTSTLSLPVKCSHPIPATSEFYHPVELRDPGFMVASPTSTPVCRGQPPSSISKVPMTMWPVHLQDCPLGNLLKHIWYNKSGLIFPPLWAFWDILQYSAKAVPISLSSWLQVIMVGI